MAKLPAFQFYPGDWMKDPALRSCSAAARGLWMDMLCLMFESDRRGFLQAPNGKPYSHDQLARMTGCSPDEVSLLLAELETSGVLSRTKNGTVFSRRLKRDEESRADHRARQKSYRDSLKTKGNGDADVTRDVTPLSHPSSSSTSSSKQIQKITPFAREADLHANPLDDIPDGLTTVEYSRELLAALGIVGGHGLKDKFARTITALSDAESCSLPDATKRLAARMQAALADGEVKWAFWIEDGGWKANKPPSRASPAQVGVWDGKASSEREKTELEMYQDLYTEAWLEKARRAHTNGETLTKTQRDYIAALEEEDAKAKS